MPALQNVLAVEVGPLPVARGGGMDDGGLAGLEHAGKRRHGRVQSEEAVERRGCMLAGKRQGDLAMQACVPRIADGGDSRQAVERAAQYDHDQARVARAGRARDAREMRPGEHGAAAEQDGAAGRRWSLATLEHGYLH